MKKIEDFFEDHECLALALMVFIGSVILLTVAFKLTAREEAKNRARAEQYCTERQTRIVKEGSAFGVTTYFLDDGSFVSDRDLKRIYGSDLEKFFM